MIEGGDSSGEMPLAEVMVGGGRWAAGGGWWMSRWWWAGGGGRGSGWMVRSDGFWQAMGSSG